MYSVEKKNDHVVAFCKGTVTLEESLAAAAKRKQITNNQECLVLGDITQADSFSQEAREYLGTPEACDKIIACAVVGNSLLHRILFNFFVEYQQPSPPFRFFTDHASALNWLRSEEHLTN